MKHIFHTTVVSFLFMFCCYAQEEAMITGKIIGDPDKLIYTNPYEGTCFSGFQDTIVVDRNGNFEIKFNLKQPSFIVFWDAKTKKDCILLVESGNKYHILFDAENEVEISGANEEGQRFYATLPNQLSVSNQTGDIGKENSLTIIHEKIQDLKNDELRRLKKLLDERKISSSFFKLVQNDRDCYYAMLESFILQRKIQSQNQNERGDLLKVFENIYAQYPPNNGNLLISSYWYGYALCYIQTYKQFSKLDFSMDIIGKLINNGGLHTHIINESKQNLTGKALELFQATYIFRVSRKYEKELIPLFEQFKKDYPKSEYSKYIKPNIDKMVEIDDKVKSTVVNDENISFLKNFEAINTLEEAIKLLKGKKIYIDVWATWCSPCLKEHELSGAVRKMLKEKDIQMLYISIDEENKDSQWRELIKKYNLEGNHIRANKILQTELMKQYDETSEKPTIAIPWYILIDEKGDIVQKRAKSPSQILSGEDIFSN